MSRLLSRGGWSATARSYGTPHPAEVEQQGACGAPCRALREVGAPAEMNIRSDERSRWSTAGEYVRSWRNGVAPIVYVTRSASIRRAASSAFQTSSQTPDDPSSSVKQ